MERPNSTETNENARLCVYLQANQQARERTPIVRFVFLLHHFSGLILSYLLSGDNISASRLKQSSADKL